MMKNRYFAFLCLGLSMVALPAHATNKKPITVGYVERVSIPTLEMQYKAKMDTGAKTSSIHAEIIELNEKGDNGEKGYVIFTIDTGEGAGNHIKKNLTRMVRIKKKEGGFLRRPVIEMTFCIAGRLVHDEVNLANRDDFNYDVLIGRNMLIEGGFLVDASEVLLTKPKCAEEKKDGKSSS